MNVDGSPGGRTITLIHVIRTPKKNVTTMKEALWNAGFLQDWYTNFI